MFVAQFASCIFWKSLDCFLWIQSECVTHLGNYLSFFWSLILNGSVAFCRLTLDFQKCYSQRSLKHSSSKFSWNSQLWYLMVAAYIQNLSSHLPCLLVYSIVFSGCSHSPYSIVLRYNKTSEDTKQVNSKNWLQSIEKTE